MTAAPWPAPGYEPGELVASVVVATRNRADRLHRLVDALVAQDDGGPFEVVIADDASDDDTVATAARLAGIHAATLPVRVVRLWRQAGPAAARNRGWRAARASCIAFTDDDCVPQPGWLHALVAGLERADVAQGRTVPDPRQAERRGPFSRTLEVTAETGYYETANIAYRRQVLERVGGFDERFRYPTGEDTDLAWRARDAGARTTFVPEAVVYHDVRPSSFLTHLRDLRRWDGVVLAATLHPELRDLFHRRWWWRGSHPPALLAGVGTGMAVAAVARRRWWRLVPAAALVAPYARYRLRIEPLAGGPRRRAAAIPAALLADLGEVGVLARSSLRYRTLLL